MDWAILSSIISDGGIGGNAPLSFSTRVLAMSALSVFEDSYLWENASDATYVAVAKALYELQLESDVDTMPLFHITGLGLKPITGGVLYRDLDGTIVCELNEEDQAYFPIYEGEYTMTIVYRILSSAYQSTDVTVRANSVFQFNFNPYTDGTNLNSNWAYYTDLISPGASSDHIRIYNDDTNVNHRFQIANATIY